MLKFIVGLKGSGKTKELISQVNVAAAETNGCVACIEKGTKLIHEIDNKVRLADTTEYMIEDAVALYGMIAGMYASNHDITHIFIDSALKICGNDLEAFKTFSAKLDEFSEKQGIKIVATNSIDKSDLPEELLKYL